MKKVLLFISFFSTAYFVVVLSILFTLYTIHEGATHSNKNTSYFKSGAQYQALPSENIQTIITIGINDARVVALENFLKNYDSPLAGHAAKIIEEAEQNELDYRLLPAIAMQESNLCKKIPHNSYNCWGFGIYGKKVTRFEDYDQAIETVSKTLSEEYISKGLVQPSEIMTKYTPGSNGSWAASVTYFMDHIETLL